MDYFTKIEQVSTDLTWNLPEQPQGHLNIIGGNAKNFKSVIKTTEFISQNYRIKTLNAVLPDALKKSLPPLPNLVFLSSTDSGSFAKAEELENTLNAADFNLVIGDLSKNSITGEALASACQNSAKPLLITRDAVDLLAEHATEETLMNPGLILMATVPQLAKLLRAIYYPKMILQSQSLVQMSEILHKFSLSYPVSVVTLHNEQILLVRSGKVTALPLEKTNYSPLAFWLGEPAAKITTLNMFNPNNFIDASISALFG